MKACIAIALISLSTGAEATKDQPLTWQQVLAWLPADTETLVVAQGTFPIGKDEKNPSLAQWITRFTSGLHRHPTFDKHQLKLAKAEMCLVVEGARNFRSPDGPGNIGSFRYEGCHFIVFTDAARAVVGDFYAALKAAAQATLQLQGQEVLYFAEQYRGSDGDTFVVRLRPTVLLIASHKGYLEEVLRRMRQPDGKRALPDDSDMWKHVDTNSLVWAVRKYDQRMKDAQVRMVGERTLTLMLAKEPLFRVREIAKEPPPPELFASDKKGEITPRPFRQVAPGVWELTIGTKEAMKDKDSLLFVQIALWLGHGFNF
jgi:hypothetical protein